jgi:hypothetical protein
MHTWAASIQITNAEQCSCLAAADVSLLSLLLCVVPAAKLTLLLPSLLLPLLLLVLMGASSHGTHPRRMKTSAQCRSTKRCAPGRPPLCTA